jgi:peroxin-5
MMGGPMMMNGMGMNPMMMGGMMGGPMGGGMMGGMNMMNRGMQQQPMYQGAPVLQQTSAPAITKTSPVQEGPSIAIVDESVANVEIAQTKEEGSSDMTETRAMTREMVRVLSQDPKFQNSEFLGFMQQISTGEVEFDGNKLKSGDAKSMEDAAKEAAAEPATTTTTTTKEAEPQNMEARLADAWKQTMEGKEVDLDAIWNEAIAQGQDFDSMGPMFGGQLGDQMMANQAMQQDQYQFPEENQYRGQNGLFEKGMEFFNQGLIAEAIEIFQAFVESETDDPSEGWRMLGLSHQEHDEDRKAIQCLEKSVEEDPYNLESLLALGVSYVNELNSERALRTLKLWVEHNPSFQSMAVEVDAYSDGSLMDEVMQLMVSAQKAALANGGDDGDVNIVLGVLYNVSRDYDSAVEAFQRALVHRSDDYSLWNKLGATLANGSRSQQAIPAYEKALSIKPKYARGRLNLGISHANLQNYEGAARAYLSALRLNPDATHIWSYLRIAFTCMERFDLVQKVCLLCVVVLVFCCFDL